MCGSLRLENVNKQIGYIVVNPNKNILARRINGRLIQAQWLGHSREESSVPSNAELVKIEASDYEERGVKFIVPKGKVIAAFLIRSKSFPYGEGVFIITRPATSEELKRCKHPRHPKLINK